MKQYIFVGLLMVCVGCGGESLTSGPSPLETFDQDRLWILMKAVEIRPNNNCVEYYREPDKDWKRNIMVGDLKKVCPEFAGKVASYLAHNGVVGGEPVHVQDVAFWDRLQVKAQDVASCQKEIDGRERPAFIRSPPRAQDFPDSKALDAAGREWTKQINAWTEERTHSRRACDPYEEARGAARLPGLDHFGISLPGGLDFGMGISFF